MTRLFDLIFRFSCCRCRRLAFHGRVCSCGGVLVYRRKRRMLKMVLAA